MMKTTNLCIAVLIFLSFSAGAETINKDHIARSNVIWDSPSKNSLGSMPLGNGDIGANVWVEPSGDIVLLLSKSDAYDEFNRLLKLGRVRISMTPSLNVQKDFLWELRLQDGNIEIRSGEVTASVWIDANHPVVQVDVQSPTPVEARVQVEIWRKKARKLDGVADKEQEERSAQYNRGDKLLVNPDILLPHANTQLAWCHRNIESQWKDNLQLTGLGDQVTGMTDPVLHRSFGAVVRAAGFRAVSDSVIITERAVRSFNIQIVPLTQIADSEQAWLKAAETQADNIMGTTAKRFAAHCSWWHNFWDRSWIAVTGDSSANLVTQAYALQRFVTACAGRGSLPIKFNGSLFTVDQVFDPDYRRWGGAYWWQNTRLIYWGLLYSGDYDLMKPLFRMYMAGLPLREAATRKYYGHEGAFYPETIYFWANFTDINYGLDRTGKADGLTQNTYIRRYWQGGLELVAIMLDYYHATQDTKFRDEMLLPMARAITTFFDQHWERRSDGKIFYSPAQSLETWHVATDPLPEIAGLRYLLPRLLELPADDAIRVMWKKLLADQPEIPSITENGKTRLLPAKTYSERKNIENPELYAVFPYPLYSLMQGGEELRIGINTWNARQFKFNVGWQQQPINAALLGLTEEAKSLVAERASDKAKGYRFPGFYGPNYDWTPDQDQISVFQIGLQRMLMQCKDSRILLLPAWPKEWDVDFKLHAPCQTTVEGRVRNGKLLKLKVTPKSRKKDVIVLEP